MKYDLSNTQHRVHVTEALYEALDKTSIAQFAEPPRTHLGASIIGNDCKAYSWNVFRWLKQEAFSGQMYRLFNRGHTEEFRFVRWLTNMGFTVHEIDKVTDKQYRITGSSGHFGGSTDSILFMPPVFAIEKPLIGEFKTHNQKSFDKLQKLKVQVAKPEHYKQMCSYGRAYAIEHGLYVAVNKNTDEIYLEILQLDFSLADDLFRKADAIVFSQYQPNKIAMSSTFFTCKRCTFCDICHSGVPPEKNCRSCKFARPVENAEWFCDNHNAIIPKEFIAQGCDSWQSII